MINVGLLIIRLDIGLLFVGHGAQKLFGWFGEFYLDFEILFLKKAD